MFSDLTKAIEPISKVCNALLHPLQTFTSILDYLLLFVPAVCAVIIMFYIVTRSKKVLNAIFFVVLAFILLKTAIVFNFVWLIGVVLAAIIIIRLVGSIL